MTAWMRHQGYAVNHKYVGRLMRQMGLEAIYAKPRRIQTAEGYQVYPYVLRSVPITQANQVWSVDITYVRLEAGVVYLVAVMAWFSRYVMSWAVSITLAVPFCLETIEQALARG